MEPNYGYVQSIPENNSKFSKKMILVAGGLVISVIIAVILLFSSNQGGISTQAQYLLVRYSNMQAMLSDTKTTRNLKNQDLSNIITSFNLTATTDYNDLITALAGQIPEKTNESIIAAESDAVTMQKIEDAYLENKLDAVYADTLIKKIDSLRALIAEIYGLSKDQKIKSTLVGVDENLRKTRQQIDELNL